MKKDCLKRWRENPINTESGVLFLNPAQGQIPAHLLGFSYAVFPSFFFISSDMKELKCLPIEILKHIFAHITRVRHLRQCVLVNKMFYRMLIPKLWHSPRQIRSGGVLYRGTDLVLQCLTINNNQHQSIGPIPLGHHVRNLELAQLDSVADLFSVLALTPQVEELRLERQQYVRYNGIQDSDMERIAQLCPHLKTLTLICLVITDESMSSFGRHCRQLRHLTLNKMDQLTPTTLFALKHCPLEQLRINYCCRFVQSPDTANHLASFHTLNSLHLHSINRNVGSDFIRRLIPRANEPAPLSLLKHLNLIGGVTVDNNVMAAFLRAHPRLETLSLAHCQLRDTALDVIATHLRSLTSLRIDQKDALSPAKVSQVICSCHRLVSVILCHREGKFQKMKRLNRKTIRQIRLAAST